jgi:Flp pilus assembly protein TadB
MANDPKNLWKDQPVSVTTYSPDDLRARLKKQQATFRLRNLLEYVAGLFVMVGFGANLLGDAGDLIKAGSGLLILGTVYVMWQLHRRASAPPAPTEGDLAGFQREQLVRQHEALSTVWRWYLAPFVPGMLILFVGQAQALPFGQWAYGAASVGLLGLVFGLIWLLNNHAARKLARQIEELDRTGDPQ